MPVNMNNISQSVFPLTQLDKQVEPSENTQTRFADTLKESIKNINDLQLNSEEKTKALAKGEIDDLHEVMIAAQKASITIDTSVQIQRKVIDAYNEVMRMQV